MDLTVTLTLPVHALLLLSIPQEAATRVANAQRSALRCDFGGVQIFWVVLVIVQVYLDFPDSARDVVSTGVLLGNFGFTKISSKRSAV